MNTENFKEFLENPSRLYQLSYQELKSLVLQYPYSTNLHYLLLQKSALEDHREFEQNRQRAATYSIDRTFLYQLLRELSTVDKKEPVLQLDEEFLELKDLSLIEMDKPPLAVADDLMETPANAIPLSNLPPLDVTGSDLEEGAEELDLSLDNIHTKGTKQSIDIIFEEEALPQDGADINLTPPSPSVAFFQASDQLMGMATTLSAVIRQLNISVPQGEQAPISIPPLSPPLVQQFQVSDKLIYKASTLANIISQLSIPTPETKPVVSPLIAPQSPRTSVSFLASDQLIRTAVSLAGLTSKSNSVTSKNMDDDIWDIEPPAPVLETDEVSPSLQKQKQLLNKLDLLLTERKAAAQVKKPAPRPKGSFTSWVQQFQSEPVKDQLGELMEAKKREELKRLKKMLKKAKKKKKKKKPDQHIIEFAKQSLTKHKAVISETLAEILAEQGEIEKSLEMYERLKLFFPEKSAYFAAIIEKLKTD